MSLRALSTSIGAHIAAERRRPETSSIADCGGHIGLPTRANSGYQSEPNCPCPDIRSGLLVILEEATTAAMSPVIS
jgi:hypothetical protein